MVLKKILRNNPFNNVKKYIFGKRFIFKKKYLYGILSYCKIKFDLGCNSALFKKN